MTERTTLEFEAKVAGIAVKAAKLSTYGEGTPGGLELKLAIEMPKQPRKPQRPWAIGGPGGLSPRPGEPQAQKKGEQLAKYEQRVAGRKREQESYDRELARYRAELAAYEAAAAAHGQRLMSYALLTGIAAVFGDQVLQVTVMPKQDILPGFAGVSLLPVEAASMPGIPAEPSEDEPDDEPEDEPEDDDGGELEFPGVNDGDEEGAGDDDDLDAADADPFE